MNPIEKKAWDFFNNIDQFSQNIIISHLGTLLNYAQRFYHRQFLTRKIANHQIHCRPGLAISAFCL